MEWGEAQPDPGSGLGPPKRRSGRISALPYPPSRSIVIIGRSTGSSRAQSQNFNG